MSRKRSVLAFLIIMAAVLVHGCGIKLPEDKLEYVGEWQSREMYLLITRNGSVRYSRLKEGGTTSVSGPIRAFEGDNFIVGVPMITTTFVVSEPPHLENKQWKMTVDGVTLVKTGS